MCLQDFSGSWLKTTACNFAVGKYVDAESDPDDVVTDLEGLLQHISGLGEALAVYNQYLALFDAAPDELNILAMAEKEANNRYQVSQAHGMTHDFNAVKTCSQI